MGMVKVKIIQFHNKATLHEIVDLLSSSLVKLNLLRLGLKIKRSFTGRSIIHVYFVKYRSHYRANRVKYSKILPFLCGDGKFVSTTFCLHVVYKC